MGRINEISLTGTGAGTAGLKTTWGRKSMPLYSFSGGSLIPMTSPDLLMSARNLLVLALVLMLTGAAVTDPVAGLALLLLAMFLTVTGICLGSKNTLITGFVLLFIIIVLGSALYPDAKSSYLKYLERAEAQK